MENAVDALKMAFAVMVFVMALSIAIMSFTQARISSEAVLYARDETNYYDYQEVSSKSSENRIVGLETIVPTLYKYYKENYTVVFKNSNGSYMAIYETSTNINLWSNYSATLARYGMSDSSPSSEKKKIYSFDLDEETKRREPWTSSTDNIKDNLDAFLSGGTFYLPSDPNNSNSAIKYTSFLAKYANSTFIENIGSYAYNKTGDDTTSFLADEIKRVITYTLIK